MTAPSRVLISDRIELRARTVEQAPEMYRMVVANRDHLKRWMPWVETTKDEKDTREYCETMVMSWAQGFEFDFAIYLKGTGKMIGSFGIHTIDWFKQTCHFGFWIDKDHEGHGYISEAIQLGEKAAIDLGFHRLVLTCDRLNERSRNVALKHEYKLESTSIDAYLDRGLYRDTCYFVKIVSRYADGTIVTNLPHGYFLKEVREEQLWNHIDPYLKSVFDEKELIVRPFDIYSPEEKARLKDLRAAFPVPYRLNLVLLKEDQCVGWSWGYQDSMDSYYMVNSAVLPEHRGRGLYSAMLDSVLKTVSAKGFQRIFSRHNITNSAIIIPKLKKGFTLTNFEITDNFGTLVHLTYFTNPTRRKVLEFRSGTLRPDADLKGLLKL